MMDRTLSELIKELLVIIDELRVIDSPLRLNPSMNSGHGSGQAEIVSRLQSEGINDGLMYTADFVDTYEAIRQRMEELGELPPHLDDGLWRENEADE